jgi:hypothetical protein
MRLRRIKPLSAVILAGLSASGGLKASKFACLSIKNCAEDHGRKPMGESAFEVL